MNRMDVAKRRVKVIQMWDELRAEMYRAAIIAIELGMSESQVYRDVQFVRGKGAVRGSRFIRDGQLTAAGRNLIKRNDAIKKKNTQGVPVKKIAEEYDLAESTVYTILRGRQDYFGAKILADLDEFLTEP